MGNTNIIGLISANVFFGNAIMSLILFLRFSPKWIKLLKKWEEMENILNSFDVNNQDIRSKINNISIIFTIIAVLEHCLYGINHTVNTGFPGYISGLYNFFISTYNIDAEKFSFTNFNSTFIISIFLWIIDNFATVIWNFTDLFIILVATGLAERYKHLNESVMNSRCNRFDATNWHQCRKKYALLSHLVKETDNFLSPLILLSFSTNLYFICIQLFNGIFVTADRNLDYVYYFMSFILILGRIFAITLSAARIHNQSKIILPKIYCCPSSSFNRETERLQYQLSDDEVTLTGMKFFSITRNFMLASNQESFHTAIGPIIKVAQYFGILPISGVMKQSPSIMEFKIKSFRTYWTVSIIVALAIIFITVIVKIIKTLTIGNSNIREVVSALVFFGHALMSLILFLRLSPKWIKLLQKWEKMENKLTRINTTGQFANLYIFVSYCYVIGRTIAVTLSASRINIESKEALPHIYLCQSSKFTDEANRLQNQLTYDDIGFTGMNFFSITRNFMLVSNQESFYTAIGPIIKVAQYFGILPISGVLKRSPGRMIAVTLSASRVNIKSKEALPHIYMCQSSKFDVEANRLQQQLTYDDVVFTGMNFFSITRNFMLVNNQESFHTAIGPTIKVAQYFGILPISGVLKQSPRMMEFKIKSFRTYWTVFIIIALVSIFITFIVTIIKTLTIEKTSIIGPLSSVVYFGSIIMSLIFFLQLSPKWINHLQKWEKMENELDSFGVEGGFEITVCMS
ncbi:hypothetical protein HCN44_007540 [Aphidius gifuensis]|uniref:Gustatory receptor n=1 Tax=Aphidius gifuensis TaxID=684658 RepID=A0A834XJB6_APHGI|nr:hypothetical protein HCN44_007540 [Aphidius gifuensis]